MPQLPDLWYDPENPPLDDMTAGPVRPIIPPSPPGTTPDIIGYQRTYKNTARPDIPTLRIIASASNESGDAAPDQPPGALADEARRQLDALQVYYDVRTIPDPPPPPPTKASKGAGATLAEEVREVALVMTFELELLDGRPPAQTTEVAAITIYERSMPNGALDNYKALRRTEAKAQIQVTSGKARVRLYRNGASVGYATDVAGGMPSKVVQHNAGRMSTYDMAVRSLAAGTRYTNCILYWQRG